MELNLTCLVFLVIVITQTFSARILAVVPAPSYSHQSAFHPLWRELSLRGHQVTLITTIPINDPSLTNLTEVDLGVFHKEWASVDINKLSELSVFEMFSAVNEICYSLTDRELGHSEVQKILKNEKAHFDVVLVEILFPGMVLFAEKFKCPLIQIYSMDGPSGSYYNFGNPIHPILNPDYMLPFYKELTFSERLLSTAYLCYSVLYNKYKFYPSQQAAAQKHFGSCYMDVEKILSNASLMFVNTDFIFHSIRPLLPNIIQIGGGTHLSALKPLPMHLQKLLDEATNGFIYFSLGSNLKSSSLPENTIKVFLKTFSELPYTVLWKFENDLPGKPDNLIISKWFPQQDIFRHPNIKLFITQGGLQSMSEALHNHIPIVGIPFLVDQRVNVNRMVSNGMGLGLNGGSLDKNILKTTMLEVMNNPKYRNKVKELAELIKDQPMTGLERAVWWTEYVIRHKGAKHLRSPALDIPAYQYYLLDVIGFIITVTLIVGYVLVKITKLILRSILPK